MIFFVIAIITFFLMNYTIYRGFILIFGFSPLWIKILTSIVVCLFFLEVVFLATFKQDIDGNIYIILASLIGVSFMLFSVTILYDIFYFGVKSVEFSPQRREVLLKILNISTVIAICFYLIRGFIGGIRYPRIKDMQVQIKGLKKPLTIVQIADVHIGKILEKDFLQNIVNKINTLHADVVVITGDLVDLEIDKIKNALTPLLHVKSKYGVYFVPGNHEYYHGVESIIEHLEKLNVKTLGNLSEQIDGINLSGVYDIAAKRMNHPLQPNLDVALQHANPQKPTILLAHQPKIVEDIKQEHKIDLILSGHTHGGQIFPFGFLVRFVQPYLYGLYHHTKKTQIYVSSGAGFWGPPIRFLAPSEIVNIRLIPS